MSLNSLFLEQNCDHALKTCDFGGVTGANCASEFCFGFPSTSGTCPQIGLDPKNCCGSSDPASCLEKWVHGGAAGASTGGDDNNSGSSGNPCASVVGLIISCSSASPSLFPSGSIYTSGAQATSLASCLCDDSNGSYDPNALDGFASSCVASGSSAHPTYFPYASHLDGFCSTIGGGGAAGGGSSAATPTPSDTPDSTAATSPAAVSASATPGSAISLNSASSSATSGSASSHASATSSSSASGAGRNSGAVGVSPAALIVLSLITLGFFI